MIKQIYPYRELRGRYSSFYILFPLIGERKRAREIRGKERNGYEQKMMWWLGLPASWWMFADWESTRRGLHKSTCREELINKNKAVHYDACSLSRSPQLLLNPPLFRPLPFSYKHTLTEVYSPIPLYFPFKNPPLYSEWNMETVRCNRCCYTLFSYPVSPNNKYKYSKPNTMHTRVPPFNVNTETQLRIKYLIRPAYKNPYV